MTTTREYDSFSLAAFFDNRTWLNQINWQKFFGGAIPSGVIVEGCLGRSGQYFSDSLAYKTVNASSNEILPGKVMINGIFAEYTGGNYIDAITSSQKDRLIVARVGLLSGEVKIVGKTQIASTERRTTSEYLLMLLKDESLGCVRNETYYEIPLAYEIYGGRIYDLRRLFYIPGKHPPFMQISYNGSTATNLTKDSGVIYGRGFIRVYGGMKYSVDIDENDTSDYLEVNPVPVCSEKQICITVKNNSSNNFEIRLPLLLDFIPFTYEWIDNWSISQNQNYMYKTVLAGDNMTMILTPYKDDEKFGYIVTTKGSASGSLDPEDYYTKNEIATMLGLKANTADLGSLAYQNGVNYETQITNAPVLGHLSTLDTLTLESSQVTGVLPIRNGGTGATNMRDLLTLLCQPITLYVNPVTGRDSEAYGRAQNSPFKTIQYAIDNASIGGETTIILAAGSYYENLHIQPYHQITITTANTNDNVTINGTSSNSSCILIDGGKLNFNKGNIFISGDVIDNALIAVNYGGILSISSNHMTVTNSNRTVSRGGAGISVSTGGILSILTNNFTVNAFNGITAYDSFVSACNVYGITANLDTEESHGGGYVFYATGSIIMNTKVEGSYLYKYYGRASLFVTGMNAKIGE